MKTLLNILAIITLFTNAAVAQVNWTVDPAHTNARFEAKHLGIAFVDGQFKKLDGKVVTSSDNDFNNAKVNFNIDVNSIDTRVEMRDNHLKSDDFFSAEKFPTMKLANATLSGKNGKFTLTGDLTIRDVTKKVAFNVVQNNGIITDPWGKTRAGFTATTTINRFDYGINYADKLPSGVFAVAPEINITINVEITKD
ncbi:polyisoprenoid-binding protein YceI [Sphingobacterium alimentarium]|uniref:Polyisoprenoid-binding protein YceI n=1 Tax=Sphingobacterium alimentarium TaxID=797292 RepID=A0A4V6P304_9SPHI|nr:YceI family protein [Sphingobacterium alimentarium]TCV09861.1 polyisoprenoid-binding protein YceI [Sphingobacterium alimentarium]